MKLIIVFGFLFNLIFIYGRNYINGNNRNNNVFEINGVYIIKNLLNNYYFKLKNNNLVLLENFSFFHIIPFESNLFYIESIYKKKRLGIDKKNKVVLFNRNENINKSNVIWNIIKIGEGKYLIKNINNGMYMEINNYSLRCINSIDYLESQNEVYSKISNIYLFNFIKLYKNKRKYFKIIEKVPIDVVIKYIDLTDKTLNRKGIKQIYKDQDNEELKFCLRSILNYITWIRKIFILMPNKKIKFLKNIDEIKEKIIYINDKDFLGFDSANIFSFTFNLFKLEDFGISKNFIYMEDDFFIGKPLKKFDFFYYDESSKKVLPFLLTKYFHEMDKNQVDNEFNKLFQKKDTIFPHSRYGWWLSIYSTNKYFIERYKHPLIDTVFTHNAIAENIDDLKEIYEEIKDYKYINETLYSKERNILTLNQPQFVNLYQLNIKNKKVHSIPYSYFEIELINKYNLNIELFVINTGGNHIPSKRHFNIQSKIMKKKFPYKIRYEIKSEQNNKKNLFIISYKFFNIIIKFSIIIIFVKIFNFLQNLIN